MEEIGASGKVGGGVLLKGRGEEGGAKQEEYGHNEKGEYRRVQKRAQREKTRTVRSTWNQRKILK